MVIMTYVDSIEDGRYLSNQIHYIRKKFKSKKSLIRPDHCRTVRSDSICVLNNLVWPEKFPKPELWSILKNFQTEKLWSDLFFSIKLRPNRFMYYVYPYV